MTRATIDVNVLLSSLIGARGPSRQVVRAWQANRFIHVSSDHIITTFHARITRPDLVARFPFLPDAGQALLPLLRTHTSITPVLPSAVVAVTGDEEDDTVLATARLGAADYLVTGDGGLLALGTYEGVRIVTPRGVAIATEQKSSLRGQRSARAGALAAQRRFPASWAAACRAGVLSARSPAAAG